VRDPGSIEPAVAGAKTVISSIQGLDDPKSSPDATDRDGNRNLIDAAVRSGVEHFILISARPSDPHALMSIARAKYAAEQHLKASGLTWTIIRPTAYMEFWAKLIGEPVMTKGEARVFGRGDNPMNFVAVGDVAIAVEMAVTDQALRGVEMDVGGPENLTMKQVVGVFERVSGKKAKISHVPLPVMRIMSVALRPINPSMARIVEAGVAMDTTDMTWDGADNLKRYPWLPQTPLIDVIEKESRPVSA
jgi:NADH dehydrogenase